MRKTLFWVIGLAAVVLVLSRSDDLATLFATVQTGAWLPLLVAVALECCKYVAQSLAVTSCFEAVGVKREPLKLIPVVFSAMFINSLAPSGGTAGALLYIEDARRSGVDAARSTPAILLYDVAYFTGFILIMAIGLTILTVTGELAVYEVVAGLLLLLAVLGLVFVLYMGRRHPVGLGIGARAIERWVNRIVIGKLHRKPLEPWADKAATSFSDAAASIAKSPKPALTAVAFMTLTAGLDMLTLVAVGVAFGFTKVALLVAAYVVAQLLTIFSPTPQGVGFVEAGLTLLLMSYQVDPTTATAIALVYRGYVYWLPFILGAIFIRVTGLFASKEPTTEQQRARDNAHVSALLVFVLGIVTISCAVLIDVPGMWGVVVQRAGGGMALSSTPVVVAGVMMLLFSRGLWLQSRTVWAFTLVTLVASAAAVTLSGYGILAAFTVLVFAGLLFHWRSGFSKSLLHRRLARSFPLIFALIVVLGYGAIGMLALPGEFSQVDGVGSALLATLATLLPFGPAPAPATAHGVWFLSSVRVVGWLVLPYGIIAMMLPWITRRLMRRFPTFASFLESYASPIDLEPTAPLQGTDDYPTEDAPSVPDPDVGARESTPPDASDPSTAEDAHHDGTPTAAL